MQIQQSTARTLLILMIDNSDHITGKSGLSAGLTIYATKAGGAAATISPTVAEIDSTNMKGWYSLALTTTHTNTLGDLVLRITGSGADPTDIRLEVIQLVQGAGVCRGTVGSSATTTSIPTSALTPAGAAADQFKGRIITFDNNTSTAALQGQSTDITASSNSATPTFTVTALTTAPASGDTFFIA